MIGWPAVVHQQYSASVHHVFLKVWLWREASSILLLFSPKVPTQPLINILWQIRFTNWATHKYLYNYMYWFITSMQADEPHEAPYGNGATEGWWGIPHYVPALFPQFWHTLLPAMPPRDRPQPSRVRTWVPFQLIQRNLDQTLFVPIVLKSYHSSFFSTLQDLWVVIWFHSSLFASYEKLSQAGWNALRVSGNPSPLVLR